MLHRAKHEKTVRGNTWIAKKYLRERLGAKPVQEINSDEVRKVSRYGASTFTPCASEAKTQPQRLTDHPAAGRSPG